MKSLTLDNLVTVAIAITDIRAAVLDDVIPRRAEREAICWTLLTCGADYQANFASLAAILRFNKMTADGRLMMEGRKAKIKRFLKRIFLSYSLDLP